MVLTEFVDGPNANCSIPVASIKMRNGELLAKFFMWCCYFTNLVRVEWAAVIIPFNEPLPNLIIQGTKLHIECLAFIEYNNPS